MGQFKPMVKMETTEPSIELKLKKGGTVGHKKMKAEGHGHKPMAKADGGVMGALAGMPALVKGPVAPVQRARTPARPSMAARRAAMAKMPMKKGGKCYAEGGLAKSGIIPESVSAKGAEKYKADITTAEKTTKTSGKTGDVKYGNGGGYKTGGVVLGNGGGYKTGGVALGNAGGFKKGGSSKKAFASGGSVNNEGKATSMPQGNKKPSTPVSISKLSGTFKKGGTVAEKKLQGAFKSENATAMKEAKAKLLDKYSPYQKAGGGQVSDSDYATVMRTEKSGKKTMTSPSSDKAFDEAVRSYKTKTQVKYPSGLTDSDIDKVLSSKKFQEGASHFSDYKRGGKAKK